MPAPFAAAAGALGRAAASAGRVAGVAGAEAAGGNLVQLAANIGQVSYAAQSAGGALSTLGAALLPFGLHIRIATASLDLFKDTVTSIGASAASFVKLASPIHVQQFQLAVDDLTASIGKILIPVLEYGTRIVRFFADVIFKLSDPLQKLVSALMKPLIALFDTMTEKLEPMIPVIGRIITVFASFVESAIKVLSITMRLRPFSVIEFLLKNIELFLTIIEPAIRMMEDGAAITAKVTDALSNLFQAIFKFTDLRIPGVGREEAGALARGGRGEEGARRGGLMDASRGAAVRPAQITSVEEYGRKAQQAAFSLGTAAAGLRPEERTAKATEEIASKVTTLPRDIAEQLATILLRMGGARDAVGRAVRDGEARAAQLTARGIKAKTDIVEGIEGTFGITLPTFRR